MVTGSVSPPGSHSVRVVASTGDEDIVIYNISDVESDGKWHEHMHRELL